MTANRLHVVCHHDYHQNMMTSKWSQGFHHFFFSFLDRTRFRSFVLPSPFPCRHSVQSKRGKGAKRHKKTPPNDDLFFFTENPKKEATTKQQQDNLRSILILELNITSFFLATFKRNNQQNKQAKKATAVSAVTAETGH